MANLHQLLKVMIEKGATDLHVTTGSPPQLRIDGTLIPLKSPPLTAPETKQLCYSILTDSQKQKFEENNELDLSFGVKGLSRFRSNIFMQRGAVAGAFRAIPFRIMSFDELGIPSVVQNLCNKPRGLILVTGPTGAGKSTAMGLLHRQDDPQSGAIRIDGVDIRDVTIDSLRAHTGVVFQESLLFYRCIADNLRVGKPDASDAALEEAAANFDGRI